MREREGEDTFMAGGDDESNTTVAANDLNSPSHSTTTAGKKTYKRVNAKSKA
jgi:hypothetical protein